MAIEITVPTLGESVADATVARWIKKSRWDSASWNRGSSVMHRRIGTTPNAW